MECFTCVHLSRPNLDDESARSRSTVECLGTATALSIIDDQNGATFLGLGAVIPWDNGYLIVMASRSCRS